MKKLLQGLIDTSDAITVALIAVYVAGMGTMAFLGWGVPAIWRWLKPLLHGLTAG